MCVSEKEIVCVRVYALVCVCVGISIRILNVPTIRIRMFQFMNYHKWLIRNSIKHILDQCFGYILLSLYQIIIVSYFQYLIVEETILSLHIYKSIWLKRKKSNWFLLCTIINLCRILFLLWFRSAYCERFFEVISISEMHLYIDSSVIFFCWNFHEYHVMTHIYILNKDILICITQFYTFIFKLAYNNYFRML